MKQSLIFIIALMPLLTSCALPTKTVNLEPLEITVLDELTGQPLAGISIVTACESYRPEYFLGVALLDNHLVRSEVFYQEHITDKDGIVKIDNRYKTVTQFTGITEEYYWINLEKPPKDNPLKNQNPPVNYDRYITEYHKYRTINPVYGGVVLNKSYSRVEKQSENVKNISDWTMQGTALIQNYTIENSDEVPRKVTVYLRRVASSQSE